MIHTILPNQRFLSLPSENLGKDWFEKSQTIDLQLESLGLELSDENVFLIYDHPPGAIQAGEGRCLIARPVIGPKKELSAPFGIHDWVQANVWRNEISLNQWNELMQDSYGFWEELQRSNRKLGKAFMIIVKRSLVPKLEVSGEVLFY